jgi:hypothetical protein
MLDGAWVVHVQEPVSGSAPFSWPAGDDSASRLAFSPDGCTLVLGAGVARLCNSVTGKERIRFAGLAYSTDDCAFACDGRTVALWESYRSVKVQLFETATGKERSLLFVRGALCAAFSPDGGLLVVGAFEEPSLAFYALPGGRVIPRTLGNSWRFSRVAFSPDGRLLAAADHEAIYLWDPATGREVGRADAGGYSTTALIFSPDSATLLSAGSDRTVIAWDVAALRQAHAAAAQPQLRPPERMWADLADEDAKRAYAVIGELAAQPREAVAFLRTRLRPAAAPDAERVARLLADLESDQFAVRQKASEELEALGDGAEKALRQALAKKTPGDLRRRLQDLLDKLEGIPAPAALRMGRALEVLERIGTPEAVSLIGELSGGNPEARLTRGAAAALQRLSARGRTPSTQQP